AGTAPCGSDSAVVTVTIVPAPFAGISTSISICGNADPVNLLAALGPQAQPEGTWSPALASGTDIFNPAVDTDGTYIYTVHGADVCAPSSASVSVTVVDPPNAGNDASVNISSNASPQDLFAELGNGAQ